jgi:hypothetical protein
VTLRVSLDLGVRAKRIHEYLPALFAGKAGSEGTLVNSWVASTSYTCDDKQLHMHL